MGTDSQTPGLSTPVLRIESLTKSFGETIALKDVSFEIQPGEVHALLGHNGSGKSTLIKILSGYHRPDSGKVFINGREVTYPMNATAIADRGVSFMHQDIGLAPTMSVLENLRLTHFTTGRMRHIRWKAERRHATELLTSFRLEISPDLPVSHLSPAQRAIVGILRAMQDLGENRGLIVLDEPTVALPAAEVEMLFDTIDEVARRSHAILFVTHHLKEPLRVAKRLSVLRDGVLVATRDVEGLTEEMLAELVVGRSLDGEITASGARVLSPRAVCNTPLLEAEEITGEVARDVSLSVRRGEILGLTGLLEAGHQEVPFLLYGAVVPRRGTVKLAGRRYLPSPIRSRRRNVAMVSGDRARAGGVMIASVQENMSIPILDRLIGLGGWIRPRVEKAEVATMLEQFRIYPAIPRLPFSTLSGGNQQKALIGRWLASKPDILLLQEPMAGVDIGAVDEICALLRAFAEGGGAVIWSSEQYEDIAKLSDRVLIFREGSVVSELTGDELNVDTILDICWGRAPAKSPLHPS